MVVVKTEVSRKYLKKLLRKGDKAKCKLCKSHMRYISIGKDGSNQGYYYCSNENCGFRVDINPEVLKKNKAESIFRMFEFPRSYDINVKHVFTLDNYILKDEFYPIEDLEYNPIKKLIKKGNNHTSSTNEEHSKFCDIINSKLCQEAQQDNQILK